MKMRELLRHAAFDCEIMGDDGYAAALRALATRFDEEFAEANRIRRTTSDNFDAFGAGTCIALLARLDAPLVAVPPKNDTAG